MYKAAEVYDQNDKTYEDLLNEFKASYEKELKNELESSNESAMDMTIIRTQYILPLFEQEWLVNTESTTMDKNKVDQMLQDVIGSRNTLLQLVAEEDYNDEQRMYVVDTINNFLRLEEEIKYVQDGGYFTRIELNILFNNLHNSFRDNFDFFTTVFYDRST